MKLINDKNSGVPLKAGQFQVKPFVVRLSNHERLNRPPFNRALLSVAEGLGQTVKPCSLSLKWVAKIQYCVTKL